MKIIASISGITESQGLNELNKVDLEKIASAKREAVMASFKKKTSLFPKWRIIGLLIGVLVRGN